MGLNIKGEKHTGNENWLIVDQDIGVSRKGLGKKL